MTELKLEKVGKNYQRKQIRKSVRANKTPNSGLNKYGEVQTALLKEDKSASIGKLQKLHKNNIDENSEN